MYDYSRPQQRAWARLLQRLDPPGGGGFDWRVVRGEGGSGRVEVVNPSLVERWKEGGEEEEKRDEEGQKEVVRYRRGE